MEMELARLLAKIRFGPGVDMGGKHNPLPSEYKAAKHFMEMLVYVELLEGIDNIET